MFRDESNLSRLPPDLDTFLAATELYWFPEFPLHELPIQRCSDANYIKELQVLDYYRNLHYELIRFIDYENTIIRNMVEYSCWLVTSMSQKGIQSPLNIQGWNQNIHPGLKRYIIANYLQLDTVPVVWQGGGRTSDYPIKTLADLHRAYGENISVKIRDKGRQTLEVSWHGDTNYRDPNGYDFWVAAAAEELCGKNLILEYLLEHGLQLQIDVPGSTINNCDVYRTFAHNKADQHDFYLKIPDVSHLQMDLWKVYYHFDPRVGVKTCSETGIQIINKFGDPNWQMTVNLEKTIKRPWLVYNENKNEEITK